MELRTKLDEALALIERLELLIQKANKNMEESYIAGYQFNSDKFRVDDILDEASAAIAEWRGK